MSSHVAIDYFSFTFCPKELEPIRRMAAAEYNVDLCDRKTYWDLVEIQNKYNDKITPEFLDTSCVRDVLLFLQGIAKRSFESERLLPATKGSKGGYIPPIAEVFKTEDAWEEMFSLHERPAGKFGYKRSWDLFFGDHAIGMAAAGARNHGCFISFNGSGCSMIDFAKLQTKIQHLPMVNITRCDLALDDYEGVYSCDWLEAQWIAGAFKNVNGGRNPKCKWVRSGGELIDGEVVYTEGSTFYVGDRRSGKVFRGYEKGRQLGKVDDPWMRLEVELHSKYREIPLHIMSNPAEYFVGSYPVLEQVQVQAVPTLILTKKKQVKAVYERTVEAAQKTYGALLNVMRHSRGMSDKEIIDQLISTVEDAVPRSLKQAYGAGIT